MADSGEQHRGLFHHKKPDQTESGSVETTQVYATEAVQVGEKPHDAKSEIKQHARKEHIAEAGALLGGAVALISLVVSILKQFEKHQAKKDPEKAHAHHIAEAVAGAVAIGAGAYAVHEHHDKKQAKKDAKHEH